MGNKIALLVLVLEVLGTGANMFKEFLSKASA